MNKTVTINIGGLVFYIEETAYEKLSNYLDKIRAHFLNKEGGHEIIEDIELRIAELFSEKITSGKQALLLQDVEAIILVMGTPENFEDLKAENVSFNSDDKINYTQNISRKRVFRDPDQKVLGGVCSGISYYFGIDPIWLRLAFVVAFLGFGAGFWLYVILWVIIPQAKTTADKLEMKGEPVNISNIEKNIKEELESVKNRVSNLSEDWKNNKKQGHFLNLAYRVLNFIINLIKNLTNFIIKLLGAFAIFVGILLLIVFSAFFFGSDNVIQFVKFDDIETFSLNDFLELIFSSKAQLNLVKVGLGLIVGSLVIWLFFSGVRVFFKLRQSRRLINAISLTLWLIGILTCVFVGVKVSNQFSIMQRTRSKTTLNLLNARIIHLGMSSYGVLNSNSRVVINKKNNPIINIVNDKIYLGYPKIDIVKNERDSVEIEIIKTCRGETKKEALIKAENLGYEYSLNDTSVIFDTHFFAPLKDKFRAQELKVVLKIPVGKIIYLHPSLEGYIYDIANVTNTYDSDMVGRKWLMTINGLSCVDCEGIIEGSKKTSKKIIIKKNNGKNFVVEEEYIEESNE